MARNYYWNYVTRGNALGVSGLSGSLVPFQGSYPNATVRVDLAGTGSLATLYVSSTGATKSNPFTAFDTGLFDFWTESSSVKLTFSGGGLPGSITIDNVSIAGAAFPYVFIPTGSDPGAVIAGYNVLGLATTFQLGAGTYNSTPIVLSVDRTHLRGAGEWVTTINFTPTAHDQDCIKLDKGGVSVEQCEVSDLTITSGNTTFRKNAIEVVSASDLLIRRVAIGPLGAWTDSSGLSKGIYIRGHQMVRVENVNIAADKPIVVGQNPYINLDCDHLHLSDLTLAVTLGNVANYNLTIEDGVLITDFLIDGTNTFNNGKGGIVWASTTAPAVSDKFTAKNIRYEQPAVATGYIVNMSESAFGIRSVVFEQVSGGANTNGFRLRNARLVSVRDCQAKLSPGKTALDIDSTCDQIDLANWFPLGGSVVSTGTLVQIEASAHGPDGTEPSSAFERWISPTNGLYLAGSAFKLFGVSLVPVTGTIGNGANVSLKFGAGAGLIGNIQVVARGQATGLRAGILATMQVDAADQLAVSGLGEVTTAPGSPTGGKFTLHSFGSAASVSIFNSIGETASYLAFYSWV